MKKFIAIFLMIFSFTSIAKAQSLVRSGDGDYGKVLYNWDGTYLRSGESRYSTPLLNFDGQKIRMGESKYSTAKWFWDGPPFGRKQIRKGHSLVRRHRHTLRRKQIWRVALL